MVTKRKLERSVKEKSQNDAEFNAKFAIRKGELRGGAAKATPKPIDNTSNETDNTKQRNRTIIKKTDLTDRARLDISFPQDTVLLAHTKEQSRMFKTSMPTIVRTREHVADTTAATNRSHADSLLASGGDLAVPQSSRDIIPQTVLALALRGSNFSS